MCSTEAEYEYQYSDLSDTEVYAMVEADINISLHYQMLLNMLLGRSIHAILM